MEWKHCDGNGGDISFWILKRKQDFEAIIYIIGFGWGSWLPLTCDVAAFYDSFMIYHLPSTVEADLDSGPPHEGN